MSKNGAFPPHHFFNINLLARWASGQMGSQTREYCRLEMVTRFSHDGFIRPACWGWRGARPSSFISSTPSTQITSPLPQEELLNESICTLLYRLSPLLSGWGQLSPPSRPPVYWSTEAILNPNSWTQILLRFLGIILRVLRLEVSVYNVYITNQFQTTFSAGGGGNTICK